MARCDVCNEELSEDGFCSACKASKEPYYKRNLNSDGISRDQFTIELNKEERAWVEELKNDLDFKSDSKVMKLALEIAINQKKVLFSRATWQYVLRQNRSRLSQVKKLSEPTLDENAMQK